MYSFETRSSNQGNNFNFNDMPVHSYIQLTEETTITSGSNTIILPAGTWVVSEARNEGNKALIYDFNNYMYMPGGYGSFYVLTDIIYNENTTNYDMLFTYLRNAGEIYGYSPKSNLILNTNRFALKPSNIPLHWHRCESSMEYFYRMIYIRYANAFLF